MYTMNIYNCQLKWDHGLPHSLALRAGLAAERALLFTVLFVG